MSNIWIDNYEIVDSYGKNLILNQKLPFAADDKKQLCMIMAMRNGMPIATIFVACHIQQFCGAANGRNVVISAAVVISAHEISPLILCILSFYHILLLFSTIKISANSRNMMGLAKLMHNFMRFAQFETVQILQIAENFQIAI